MSRGDHDLLRQDAHGAWPTQLTQLIPYFNPPLAPADAEKLVKAGSAARP